MLCQEQRLLLEHFHILRKTVRNHDDSDRFFAVILPLETVQVHTGFGYGTERKGCFLYCHNVLLFKVSFFFTEDIIEERKTENRTIPAESFGRMIKLPCMLHARKMSVAIRMESVSRWDSSSGLF